MSCPRTFEVEAARDGRLADRSSLDRHLRTCTECSARSEALDRLASELRQHPIAGDDELAAQRGRHRLLAAFDTGLQAPPRRRGLSVGLLAMALAAGVAITYLALRQPPSSSTDQATRDPVQIDADRARWSRIDDGATTIVRLDDGEARFRVDHYGTAHRLVVIVPDGQIDDLGTTFRVRVHAGHTAAITVEEGGVLFRREGEVAIPLVAGDHWVAHVPVAATAVAPPTAPTPVKRNPPARPTATAPRREPPVAAVAEEIPIERELRAAIASLDAGDNSAAAGILRGIVRRYPDDPRAEDAAYLLVIALQRGADDNGARTAARDYLRRFPNGFRRTAIEPIAAP